MMQMISLMNMLLCKENLDLRLTPYKILATSFDDGFVCFFPFFYEEKREEKREERREKDKMRKGEIETKR